MSDANQRANADESTDGDADERTELLRKGDELYEADEYEDAIERYTEAIELDPEDASGYYKRGRAHSSFAQQLQVMGKYDEAPEQFERAFEDLTRAIELNPDHAMAYYKRATAYEMSGRPEESIPDFDRAVELDPEHAKAYRNRGNAYQKLGEYEKAIESYSETIELKPESEFAYNNRGTAYANVGEYEKALDDYGEAIDLNPEYLPAYLNRAELHLQLENPERALDDANEVLALGDGDEITALGLLFVVVSKFLLGEETPAELERYREVCSREFGTRWSPSDLESWLESADLDDETEDRIREAIGLLREHVGE